MENTRLVEGIRKTQLRNEEIELFKQSFVIVPYQISGFIDYTNRGASDEVINPDDFETFKRVWTGNDACVLCWKNSLNYFQNSENKQMEQSFQLGEVFLGALELNGSDNNINTDASFSEYKSQQIETRLTFRVHKLFNITDYYQLMFYKIPEISKSTLFRIESIEKDYAGRELLGYVITFKSVNQELANTGRARQQNVMPNSPGQGYLECVVEDSTWPERIGKEQFDKLVNGVDYYEFFDRYITGSVVKIDNNPVRKVVVKLLGNGVLHTFAMLGRPAIVGSKEFLPQRVLFVRNLTQPSTPTLFRTQNNSQHFYFGEFFPTLLYWKDMLALFKDALGPVNQWKYEGWLQFDYSKLAETNILENENYKYSLFGYYDKSSGFVVPWIINTDTSTIDTSNIDGCAESYTIGGSKKIEDHLFDNFWTQKMIKVLPMNNQETLSYGWSVATGLSLATTGLVGFFVGTVLAGIGIAGAISQKQVAKTFNGIRGIVSAPFIDFTKDMYKQLGGKESIPFNSLNNDIDNDNPSEMFFKNSTLNICFEGDITDSFISDRLGEKVLTTDNIGQVAFENGEYILESQKPFLLNGDAKLVSSKSYGFIIDGFKIQATFNGDISVEFLDANNDVVWSGVYQSEGKWTGSMREIWTEKNCSVFGRENMFFTEPVPYPKPLPPSVIEKPVNITLSKEQIAGNLEKASGKDIELTIDLKDWEQKLVSRPFEGDVLIYSKIYYGGKKEIIFKAYEYDSDIKNFNEFISKYQTMKIDFLQNAIFNNAQWRNSLNWGPNASGDYSYEISSDLINISKAQLNVETKHNLTNINSSKLGTINKFEQWRTTPTTSFSYKFYEIDNELWVAYKIELKTQDNNAPNTPRTMCFWWPKVGIGSGVGWIVIKNGGLVDYRTFIQPTFIKVV